MSLLALILAVAGPILVGWGTLRRFESFETAPSPQYDDSEVWAALKRASAHIEALTDGLSAVEEDVASQNLAIAEGIERVDRAERRVRAAVARARRRMEELGYHDEGLDAEAEQLRLLDDDESATEGVPPLRGAVAGPEPFDMSAFPGDWRPFVGHGQ